ncbi:MAG: hypothetical protein RPU32_08865, partial [Candidatus Sedimenticola sp. (ex Thyasira tokunagai)]
MPHLQFGFVDGGTVTLTHKEGEEIIINTVSQIIIVKIDRAGGGQTRTGFDVDDSIKIWRSKNKR